MSFARPLLRATLRRAHGARRAASTAAGQGARFSSAGARFGAAAGFSILAGAAVLTLTTRTAHADAGRPRQVSLNEFEKHNHFASLWVTIDGKVYDVTKFAAVHPGGSKVFLNFGVKDASSIFHAIHPANTIEKHMDQVVYIGELDEEARKAIATEASPEEERIAEARENLIGVDSLVTINDLERYAKPVLPFTAWAYYSTGSDTEAAKNENEDAFKRIFFRPRVMRDVENVDTSTTILGVPSTIPVYVCPTARNGLGQPEGEVAVTRGAGARGIFQVLSHYASRSLEEVRAACREGQQVGWQCYFQPTRAETEAAILSAVENGAHSIWVTVDTSILGKRATERRMLAESSPTPPGTPLDRNPVPHTMLIPVTWDDIAWIRKLAPGLPIVIKGVGAWEDVVMAHKYGADAIVLSNHGGRQLDYAQPPIKTLADVREHAPELLGRKDFAVFVDGGVRNGTDVLKALCLGANGVGLGRPFIYAASGWGSEGVEKAVMILQEEIDIGMRLLGVTRVDQLGPEYLDTSKL